MQKQIGAGASGVVYLAWDRHLERFVAVKEEKRQAGGGSDGEKRRKAERGESEAGREGRAGGGRLREEMEMLKALKHPMLPEIYDYFGEDTRYLVMEYIPGESLHNYIEREGSVPEEQACCWAAQLLDLLLFLHTRKPAVIYRDLKPENIIVCPDGNVRVVDFGAALSMRYDKRSQEYLAGTPGYAAPEQLGGITAIGNGVAGSVRADSIKKESVRMDTVDERSDIYTFGATLYHMVTGYNPSLPPFGIRPVRAMNPALTKGIERIIGKCTENAPSKRYQTVEEVNRDLQRRHTLRTRRGFGQGRRGRRQYVIRRMEKRIWLTEKKTTGLLGIAVLLGMTVLGSLFLSVKCPVWAKDSGFSDFSFTEQVTLPVTLYNQEGQKLLIRRGSAYQPDGKLILELGEELFEEAGMQKLCVTLTDNVTGKRQERVIYVQGTK